MMKYVIYVFKNHKLLSEKNSNHEFVASEMHIRSEYGKTIFQI